MTKLNQNFKMYKGEKKKLGVPVVDQDGNPLDLSAGGVTAIYKVTEKPTSAGHLLSMDNTKFAITGTGNNIYLIPFIHNDTKNMDAGNYYHELRVFTPLAEIVVFTGHWDLGDSPTNDVTESP